MIIKKHHYHSPLKRGILSLTLITIVMVIGTVGMHRIDLLVEDKIVLELKAR